MADGGANLPDSISLLYAGIGAFFTALAAIVTGALRGKWFSNTPPAPTFPNEQRYFFDGPLAAVITILRDNKNHLSRVVDILGPIPEELRKQSELMRQQNELLKEISQKADRLPSQYSRRGR